MSDSTYAGVLDTQYIMGHNIALVHVVHATYSLGNCHALSLLYWNFS